MRRAQRTAVTAVALLTALATSTSLAVAGPNQLVQLSIGDPTAGCTAGAESGHLNPNTETEPFVSVDPGHSGHVIATWQQDRWSNGGAHAGGYAWTKDGNHYTEGLLPFGICAGAGSSSDYNRISDLWVSWGPDGVAYTSALQFDDNTNRNGVGAATTFDGGATWSYAQPVIADDDAAIGNDKNAVTADSLHPGVAYQVWDRIYQPFDASGNATAFDGPAMISVTHDHGRTWSAPARMVDTSLIPFTQTIGNIIVENPTTGELYDFFNQITYNDANNDIATDVHYAMVTSTDEGATWSAPRAVTPDTSVNEVDPNDPAIPLRAGGGLESVAVDPASGKIYLAYEGSDFNGGNFDQIQLVSSTDGGATWSAPALVSQAPGVAAFTPSVAVDHNGTLNLSYYDVRHLQPGNTTTLPTARYEVTFPGGDLSRPTERQVTPDFDWLQAPRAGGHMLGDYEGMAPAGTYGVQSVFVTTMNAPADRSDVFTEVFHGPFGGGSGAVFASGGSAKGTHAAHKLNR